MGASESKRIDENLEEEYKSVRKYYDEFYGEMTVIENKKSKAQYGKIQKILPSHDSSIINYIKERQTNNNNLINLHKHYFYEIDLCSGTRQHIFILQYCTHTLYQQIADRQQRQEFFTLQELLSLFERVIDTVMILKRKNQRYLMSNSLLMYLPDGKVKGIEQMFSNKNELWETEHFKNENYEQFMSNIYLSPESFLYFCRKEFFKSKEILLSQSSLIFTLGINFLECALLADISDIYEYSKKYFNTKKLMDILEEVYNNYGNFLHGLICRMVDEEMSVRPNLRQIKELLKSAIKKNSKKEIQKRVSVTLQFPY